MLAVVGVAVLGITKQAEQKNTKLHVCMARAGFRKQAEAGLSRAIFGCAQPLPTSIFWIMSQRIRYFVTMWAVVGVTLLNLTKHARRNAKLHMYVARARFRKQIDAG